MVMQLVPGFQSQDSGDSSLLRACFSSIPQGDHLGVEFATCAHRGLLHHHGLLPAEEELRADGVWRGSQVAQGFVIDDLCVISVENEPSVLPENSVTCPMSQSLKHMQVASKAYEAEGILGSAGRGVVDDP